MTPSPGTVQTASGANRSRSGKPSLRANASKIRRTTASLAAVRTARLPLVDQTLHVPALRVGEREQLDQPPGLGRVVVRNRGLEPLALRRRLPQLSAEPAQEAYGGLIGHRPLTLLTWTRILAIASRRDQRRYRPDPLDEDVTRCILDAGRLAGSASNRQPWTFVVVGAPGTSSRRSRPTVFAPDNVLGAGLVVAVVVAGKGPVSFDAGRAAQNMLLAAWNEGMASCPNGIADRDAAHAALELSRGGDARDRAHVRPPGAAARSADRARPTSGAPARTAARWTTWYGASHERRRFAAASTWAARRSRRSSSAAAGRVVGQARRNTPRIGGPEAVAKDIALTVTEAATAAGVRVRELAGVGVGAPGSIDVETGSVVQVANIEGWDGPFPLGPALSERLGVPVAIGNDVSVAVEAERRYGAGRGVRSFLGVFWGTGVGGGLVLDGRLAVGNGSAGEIGHMCVKAGGRKCTCGLRGCVEAYAGRWALEQRARREARKRKTVAVRHPAEAGS